jgi:hypothetical protein
MRKIAEWLFEHVLVPLLRELIIAVLKQLLLMLRRAAKSLMEKWRKAATAKAKTKEERDAVNEEYRQKERDVEEVFTRMEKDVDSIVIDALRRAEKDKGKLLGPPDKAPSLARAKKRDDGKRAA